MPVIMNATVPNMTPDTYDRTAENLMPLLAKAKGFISHAAYAAADGGWRVTEIWETEADARAWFDQNVRPALPPDVTPDRQYRPLHNLLKA